MIRDDLSTFGARVRGQLMSPSRRFRLFAILLLIVALFFLLKQGLAPSNDRDEETALAGFGASTTNGASEPGPPKLPTSMGSRDYRGSLIPVDEGCSSFNAYLKQYRSLTTSALRQRLLREMIPSHGRMFGPQILELIKSFEPAAEGRIPLLHLGMLHASENREIHAYALQQFPPGKDRSTLIGSALTYYPVEQLGPFLASMESSAVEGDLKETARLIADRHLLGRPQISDEQLQQWIDSVDSPELRTALLSEAAERPKRERPLPVTETE